MLWEMGRGTQLIARALDAHGTSISGVAFEWTTANPSVATVVDGTVTATGDGWTEVTAAAGGVKEGASIVVATPEGPKDRTDCIACHADAYLGKHNGSGTPETCLQCHVGPTWTGGEFDHPSVANGFELLGAHSLLSCGACHEMDGTPKYPGVADDQCISRHQSEYDAQHGGSGTPTTCLGCHTRDAWTGADFDHSTAFERFRSSECARDAALHGVPRSGRDAEVPGRGRRPVHCLPPGGLQQRAQWFGIPDDVPHLPLTRRLDRCGIRPRRPVLSDCSGQAPGQVERVYHLPRGFLRLLALLMLRLSPARPGSNGRQTQRCLRLRLRQ